MIGRIIQKHAEIILASSAGILAKTLGVIIQNQNDPKVMLRYEAYFRKLFPAVADAFIAKVKEYATLLGLDPNWMMSVMYFESARTFSPSIKHPSGIAVGLIQFLKPAAQTIGVRWEDLPAMNHVQQLYWVYKYYAYWKKVLGYKGLTLSSGIDLYTVNFYPNALGKPDSYVLGSEVSAYFVSQVAKHNPGFDGNKDGKITYGEFKGWVRKYVFSDYKDEELFKKKVE